MSPCVSGPTLTVMDRSEGVSMHCGSPIDQSEFATLPHCAWHVKRYAHGGEKVIYGLRPALTICEQVTVRVDPITHAATSPRRRVGYYAGPWQSGSSAISKS